VAESPGGIMALSGDDDDIDALKDTALEVNGQTPLERQAQDTNVGCDPNRDSDISGDQPLDDNQEILREMAQWENEHGRCLSGAAALARSLSSRQRRKTWNL
jgi:hypothetical protein